MFSPIKPIPEVSTNSEGSTPTAPCASPFRGATPFMCSTPSPLHFKDPLVRERIGLGSQPTKWYFPYQKKIKYINTLGVYTISSAICSTRDPRL